MPHTRHPLDYALNRLYLRVGLALGGWLELLPPVPKARRPEVAAWLAAQFELDRAVEARLLKAYHFRWDRQGRLRTIHLVPHERFRGLPGIPALKELFFS